MKINEKLQVIQENNFGEWLKTRQEVEQEVSDSHTMFCVCGRLATGLHERNCSKFKNKVIKESLKRLSYLLN